MKIQAKIRTFLAENLVTLRRAPVEMAVAAYLFVIGVLAQHHVFPYSGEQLLAGPIVLLLTFLCNKWFAKGWLRALYYLSGLVVIPFRWADMGEWIENPAYYVTIIIGLLAGLLCGWHKDNRRFTEDLLRYVWDGISALFLTGVAYLLLLAIFFSIVYIFGIFKGITSDFCADAALLYRTVAFGFPHVQPQVGTGRTGILEAARHAAQLGAFARRTGIYGTALPLFCENRRHLVAAPRGYRLPRLRFHADRRSSPSRPDPAEQTLLRLVL